MARLSARSLGAGADRDESSRRAYVEGGMSMSAIAKAAGLLVSIVSRLIARLEGQKARAGPTTQHIAIKSKKFIAEADFKLALT